LILVSGNAAKTRWPPAGLIRLSLKWSRDMPEMNDLEKPDETSLDVSVIAPVYNEEKSLATLYDLIREALEKEGLRWELVLVNDGSADNSPATLDVLAEGDPRVKVVHFRRNYGQTAAMMAGINFASGDIIVPIDADLQNDPADIPRLLAKLREGFDVCSGWRKTRKDDSLRRNLPSRLANMLISRVSGVRLHDYGCSLKAYRKEVVKGVKLYGEMHRFIPIYASWHGARVTEIPVNHNPRMHGKSNYGLERIFKVLLDLLVVKFLYRYAQKPIYVFGGIGLASLALSGLLACYSIYLKIFEDLSFIRTPVPLLVVFTAMTGIVCILMGLLAEILMRTWHESQDKTVYEVRGTKNIQEGIATSLPERNSG
jgi:glycosyltransferase involved in cell wall biosynthesis